MGAVRIGTNIAQMPTKKLNLDEKRERLAGELRLFVHEYGRKAQRGEDQTIDDTVKKPSKKFATA